MNFKFDKLRKEWQRQGFRDKDVARMIGITPPALSNKIRGITPREISTTQLALICEQLEVPINQFFK